MTDAPPPVPPTEPGGSGSNGAGRASARWIAGAVGLLAVVVVVAIVVLVGDGDDEDGTSTTAPTFDDTTTPSTGPTTTGTDDTATTSRPTGTDPAVALELAVELAAPSAVVDRGDGAPVLAATLDGRVHVVDLEAGTSEVVLDLSGQVSTGGERGLLGMAVDPDGERLYVDYTDRGGDTDVRSWPLVDGLPQGGPGDGVVHLELDQPFANHNGGHLSFGPDGLLWIGTGDGGSGGDPQENAQDAGSLLGKMLRVAPDPAGGVQAPASNPDWGGRPEVWAVGLRNPWRYTFDRDTGRLWVADVGQDAVEEVSVVGTDDPRPNFGWDDLEGDRPFEGSPSDDFVAPVLTYEHGATGGCSITGGYVYRGEGIPSLHGWYLFGDYCGGWIRAVPADDPGVEPVELVADAGPAISFAERADGELLFLTENGIHRVVGA